MQNPRNLRVYAEARALGILIYELTSAFPAAERFGITAQMRRAAVSVGSNIAEGCGRQGNRALLAYLHQTLGSLNELDFQADLAQGLGLCSTCEGVKASASILAVRRMIIRLIDRLRARPDRPEA
jgi:four helix bundle protein